MTNKKTFGSISSDNNVFDLEHVFRRIAKEMGITDATFVEKLRVHYTAKFPYLNDAEQAIFVARFLTGEMTFDRFQVAMDVLGCKMDIVVHHPVKSLKEQMQETGVRPPQFLYLDQHVVELDLPARFTNVLLANEIETFGQLVQKTENEVRRFVNMGQVGMTKLREAMRAHGLSFEMDVKGWEVVKTPNPTK